MLKSYTRYLFGNSGPKSNRQNNLANSNTHDGDCGSKNAVTDRQRKTGGRRINYWI